MLKNISQLNTREQNPLILTSSDAAIGHIGYNNTEDKTTIRTFLSKSQNKQKNIKRRGLLELPRFSDLGHMNYSGN